jgi:hypothetical protein
MLRSEAVEKVQRLQAPQTFYICEDKGKMNNLIIYIMEALSHSIVGRNICPSLTERATDIMALAV